MPGVLSAVTTTSVQAVNGNISGRRLPIAVAPTGTDNALAASLGIINVPMAALVLLKVCLV